MKFIFDNGGQTCNKFWSYLAPLQYAYQNKEKLYVIYPDKDLRDFPNLTNNPYIRFPLYSPYINNLVKSSCWEKICRLILGKFIHVHSIIKIVYPRMLWNAWHSHKALDFNQIRPLAHEIFQPDEKIITLISKIFDQKRHLFDIIVGLHIRRGDYKTWKNGKFYFNDEEYLTCCKRILNFFPKKRVGFFIASTDFISESSFSEIDYFQIPDATGPIDLYGLSKCDYIFGPPSTFSNWAAFYGNHPIKFIENIQSFDPTPSLCLDKYNYPTWSEDYK